MGRPERPLDRDAGPLEAFAVDLRELRNAAGKVSYRALADRAGFSPSVLSAAASGFSLPTLRVTLGLVTACGGDPHEWTRRWHAVARELRSGEHGAGSRPGPGAAVPPRSAGGPAPGATSWPGNGSAWPENGPGGWPVGLPAGSGGWPAHGPEAGPSGWPAGTPDHGPTAGSDGRPQEGPVEWAATVAVGGPGDGPPGAPGRSRVPAPVPGRGTASHDGPAGRSDDGSPGHHRDDAAAGPGGDPLGRLRGHPADGRPLGPATAGPARDSSLHSATVGAAGETAPGHPSYPAKARRAGRPGQPPVMVPYPAGPFPAPFHPAQVHPVQPQMALLPRPAQLPVASVRLAGRARETTRITAISSRGRRNGRSPILISGAIGTGKSAVAMHWCHRSAPQFPDGVLYADLAEEGGDAAPDVLAGFLLALGTPPGRIPVNPVHRAALYRSVLADRRMLVLLDNARDEAQVRLLLATAPGSQVLVTSRSRMAGLDGVERIVLEAMPPEQSIALLGAIVGHDQVAAHLKAALEVAALCDHLPVALRTVGTRIAVRHGWTLPQAAGQLRDERRRVDCLTAGRPGLRESFRLAHRGLDADSRRMLMRVARLHRVEFDASVPAAVTKLSPAEAEEALETLVDTGLLQTAATRGSYRLPVLFRLLSLEMLRSAPPVAAEAVPAAG